MQFKDVIGQAAVKQHLAEMISHNRLSHALLFTGKEGTGALPLALAFAQYVMCDKVNGGRQVLQGASLFGEPAPQEAGRQWNDSCGVCGACKKAAGLVHP